MLRTKIGQANKDVRNRTIVTIAQALALLVASPNLRPVSTIVIKTIRCTTGVSIEIQRLRDLVGFPIITPSGPAISSRQNLEKGIFRWVAVW